MSSSILAPVLARLESRLPLPSADRQAFLALPCRTQSFAAGQYIVREGHRPSHCYVLLKGFAYRSQIVGDGGRQILGIHLPGEFVDVQNAMLDVADHNVQALTPVEVAAIPIEAIVGIMASSPRIDRAIWTQSLVDAAVFREWLANVGRRDARSRMAHLLCELAVRQEAGGISPALSYHLPMTQEHLADALGLTPVHVNRTLKVLEADGLISRAVRALTILDWRALQKVGDFSPTYLHLERRTEPAAMPNAAAA